MKKTPSAEQPTQGKEQDNELSKKLDQINPDNLHGEISTGETVGNEFW